jgi:hypothetical protein
MRMRPVPYVVAAILGVATSTAVGCGSTNQHLIPSGASSRLQADFDRVANAVAAGRCAAASAGVQDAYNDYASLPATVDAGLRHRLKQGIDNLATRAPIQCAQAQTQTQTQPTTTETQPPTTGTTTTPPPTTTTGTTTTPPPTTTTGTTTTPPPTTTTPGGTGGTGADGTGTTGTGAAGAGTTLGGSG